MLSFNKGRLFFDGGMGTMLQASGLAAGEAPEHFMQAHPECIVAVHKEYLLAGADVLTLNTFGANPLKLPGGALKDAVFLAARCARQAMEETGRQAALALDIGPLGQLLEPVGALPFEDAYAQFLEVASLGVLAGVDLILIETMSDLYEAKAAVCAAKAAGDLPVVCSMTFSDNGRTLTGSDVKTCVAVLEGLGVDALGLNCGYGPAQTAPLAREFVAYASVPVIAQPNAGMPQYRDGETVYDVGAAEFAQQMQAIAQSGVGLLGGCCGTTPEHIRLLRQMAAPLPFSPIRQKHHTLVCSASRAVEIAGAPVIIGERINPTGKKRMKEALKTGDFDYLLNEALSQKEAGAHVLDVNVGIPGIDEPVVMRRAIQEVQAVVDLPLQIDSSDAETLAGALRIYNGKPILNSVNGKKDVMDEIFPLAKRYGAVVIGLTLDEGGIPEKAEDRLKIARRIVDTAAEYGIAKKDILIDCLVLTASAQQEAVLETIKAVRLVRETLGVKTVLGVSNVSFGLPARAQLNATFLTMALTAGLDCCIINPKSDAMMQAIRAYNVLAGHDLGAAGYIAAFSAQEAAAEKGSAARDLRYLITSGLKEEAAAESERRMDAGAGAMELVETAIIPALDTVGQKFETGTMFLPQLIKSAESAKAAFAVISRRAAKEGREIKGKIVIATVLGDVHDIGKNIVKLLLQNYGFEVLDLGKNVPIETVVDAVKTHNIRLLGLSALMTTTVVNMEKTIAAVKRECPTCQVMVGGAVLTESYAKSIGADFYAPDALKSVDIAKRVFE